MASKGILNLETNIANWKKRVIKRRKEQRLVTRRGSAVGAERPMKPMNSQKMTDVNGYGLIANEL